MDMLDNLLGGRGCGADGTLSRNPVTAMVDRIFDSHAAADESGTLLGGAHSANTGQEGFLYDESAVRSISTADPTDWLRDFGMQSHQGSNGSMEARTDPVGFAGFNDRWTASSIAASDPSMNMMIQQQAMMSQMMQMQVSILSTRKISHLNHDRYFLIIMFSCFTAVVADSAHEYADDEWCWSHVASAIPEPPSTAANE
jgi:hypothetical protein